MAFPKPQTEVIKILRKNKDQLIVEKKEETSPTHNSHKNTRVLVDNDSKESDEIFDHA